MSEREALDHQLRLPFDEVRTAAVWSRIAARRRAPKRIAARWLLLAAGLAAVATTVVVAARPTANRVEALTSSDPSISVMPGTTWTSANHDVTLDDQSRIVLGADARLEILANDATRFVTLLHAGSAHFDVHPDGPRRWEIETALASVEVVGTAFEVRWRDHQLEVSVDRGVVLVHGEQVPGRVVRLTMGQRIVIGPQISTAATLTHPEVIPPPPVPLPPSPIAPARTITAVHAPDRVVTPTKTIAEVIAEADRLSSGGDPAGAAKLLEGARTQGGDPASGFVAFTLGRLYLDALAKPELAAAAFDEVIAGGNPRSLLEDAYARRVEAWVRAHRHDQAGIALAAYMQAYPRGRRIGALRRLVEAP